MKKIYVTSLAGLLGLALTGCSGCEPAPPGGAGGGAGVEPVEELGVKAVTSDDPQLAGVAGRLPEGWTGTGTLVGRETVPPGAPAWVKIKAGVVDKDGKRFLEASGEVVGIRNASLARSAAGNRARAELQAWLGQRPFGNVMVSDFWAVPNESAYARAYTRVPRNWQPGMGLVSTAPGAVAQPVTGTPAPTPTPDDKAAPAAPQPEKAPGATPAPTTEKL